MKINVKFVLAAAIVCCGYTVMAGPHHRHHKRDGLDLANGIVDLVMRVIAPAPVVVAPAPAPVVVAPPPAPVVVAPPPAPVVVTPAPVVVAPPPRHYRPAPPPRHHRPAPPRHHR